MLETNDIAHEPWSAGTTNRLPEIGTLIGGVYRVCGLLGSGAMGVVFVADDTALNRKVAIKFVHGHLTDDAFKERFRAEAQAMARVSHPHVLQIFSSGEHQGTPYFVMQCVHGDTLDEWIAEGPRDLDAVVSLLASVCDGVQAIHAAGTVHRDLKPSNILVDREGHPFVADLGLATAREGPLSKDGEIVGTPAYMAPEVAFPGEHTHGTAERADIYSLGCIAYELLTGVPPFKADQEMGLLFQHLTVAPEPPSKRRPSLPRQIDGVLLRAMAKKPADRFNTAHALGVALRAAANGVAEPTRVLVAEDHADFRDVLAIALELAFPNATLECVDNGRSALAAFDREKPSVAILDLAMPELDGIELTGLLRSRDSEIPIIVLTASGDATDWKRLSAMGVDRFLMKPVVLEDVVEMVRRVLRERAGARRVSSG